MYGLNDDESWAVGVECLFGLATVFETETVLDLGVDPLGVLKDILEAGNSVGADLLDVEDAVVAAVNGGAALQGARVPTVLEALQAVTTSFRSVTTFALVADGGEEAPAAGNVAQVGKPTSLAGGPKVNALGGLAGALVATEAGAELVDEGHRHG